MPLTQNKASLKLFQRWHSHDHVLRCSWYDKKIHLVHQSPERDSGSDLFFWHIQDHINISCFIFIGQFFVPMYRNCYHMPCLHIIRRQLHLLSPTAPPIFVIMRKEYGLCSSRPSGAYLPFSSFEASCNCSRSKRASRLPFSRMA